MNRTRRIYFSRAVLALAVAAARLLTMGTSARAGEVVGRVIKATGSAQIQRAGASLPANDGAQIELHDQVTTQADSTVKLEFPDGSSLALDASSSVAIDDAGIVNGKAVPSRVTLLDGKIHANVPDKATGSAHSIEVDTPNTHSKSQAPSP